jgi:Protein of unknown function (DUF669)
MQTSNHQEAQTYGGQSFEPFEWNARELEPEAAAGEYSVTIRNAKFMRTKPEQGSYPKINLTLKITATATDTEDADKSVGGTVFDSITFYPRGERSRVSNINKRRFLELLEACGLDEGVMPSTIKGEEDFAEITEALKDKEITAWVSHSPRNDGKGVYVNVSYAAPRGMMTEEEPVEERPRARQASRQAAFKAKPAASNKNGGARRR